LIVFGSLNLFMPELPEVETIARALRDGGRDEPSIVGKRVKEAHVYWKRTLAEPSASMFTKRIRGEKVKDVRRRGKFIIIQFTAEFLLFHLRMSGDLKVESNLDLKFHKTPVQKHDRLILEFYDGMQLVFNDTRKFGRAWLVKDPQTILSNLGPEPLNPALMAEEFHQMLTSRSRQMKPLLLDQKFLAGLGNIYTDEALHLAKLHPMMNSGDITFAQAKILLKAIRSVLKEGIKRNGASIDWVYRGGDFQNHFSVYQCTGKSCPVCGTTIQRIVVGQRSTHICPYCQPEPSKR
jgi:formamidopyrimidine-DNA glycosylase